MPKLITKQELRDAFIHMRDADVSLDDMDYLTKSPKLVEAMPAADRWRELSERFDQQQRELARIRVAQVTQR